MYRGGGHLAVPKHLKASDPRAALLIEQAQGHPLTPQQRVQLAEAQGKMTVGQARQKLMPAKPTPSDGNWLWNLLGVREVADAFSHPGVGTALEALASLPLPITKLAKGGEIAGRLAAHEAPTLAKLILRADRAEHMTAADALGRVPAGVKHGLHHSGTAFKVGTTGAALTNAAVNPNKNTALTALGFTLPVPPAERVLLHRLAEGAKATAAANSAVNNGSIGAGLNAYGSSPLRAEEDAAAVERLVSPVHRGIAAHDAVIPEGEGNAPLAELIARLLGIRGNTTRQAPTNGQYIALGAGG